MIKVQGLKYLLKKEKHWRFSNKIFTYDNQAQVKKRWNNYYLKYFQWNTRLSVSDVMNKITIWNTLNFFNLIVVSYLTISDLFLNYFCNSLKIQARESFCYKEKLKFD